MLKYYRKNWRGAILVFAWLVKLVVMSDVDQNLMFLALMYPLLVVVGSVILKLELYLLATKQNKIKKFLSRILFIIGSIYKLLS